MWKRILGVVIGFIVWTVLWLLGGALVQAALPGAVVPGEPVTGAGVLLSLLGWSVACSIAAGVVVGRIAGRRRLAASAVLGLILLVVGVGVQAAMWNLMPLWYHLPFLALLLPATLAGAALARRGKMGEPPLSLA